MCSYTKWTKDHDYTPESQQEEGKDPTRERQEVWADVDVVIERIERKLGQRHEDDKAPTRAKYKVCVDVGVVIEEIERKLGPRHETSDNVVATLNRTERKLGEMRDDLRELRESFNGMVQGFAGLEKI